MSKNKSNFRQSFGGSETSDDEDIQTSNNLYSNDKRFKEKSNENTADRVRFKSDRHNKLARSNEIDEDDEDDDNIVTTKTKSKTSKHRQINDDDNVLSDRSNTKADKKRNKNKKKGKGNKIAPISSTLYQDETHNMLSGNKTSWSNSLDMGSSDSRPRRLKPLDLSSNSKSRAYRGQAFNMSAGDEVNKSFVLLPLSDLSSINTYT